MFLVSMAQASASQTAQTVTTAAASTIPAGTAITFADGMQLAIAMATALAALAALLAAKHARRAADMSEKHAKQSMTNELVGIHVGFQSTIREIQTRLPVEVNSDGWTPDADQSRTIRMYWYAVFDEWLGATRLGANTSFLRDDYYRNGVRGR